MQVKINAEEYFFDENISLEDAKVTARIARDAGADAITVSASHNYAVSRALLSSWMPQIPNKLLPLAAAIREAADRAIANGELDFLAQGRKQIADEHTRSGSVTRVRCVISTQRTVLISAIARY